MEKSPRLYSELMELCGQPGQWRDLRHLQTLAWMVVGLIETGEVSLPAWVPFIRGRAQYAQSTQRRFRRWLGNRRIEVAPLYGPLIEQALREWGTQVVAQQKRRWVDPHWLRGNSYLRIGWQWVKSALARGWELFATLHLSGTPDPDPCRASASSPIPAPPLTFTQTICYAPI